MSATGDDAAKVRELGWRQGSVLPPSLFSAVKEATGLDFKEGESFPVVISQDCDVVHRSYVEEPEVEIIRAVLVPKADGNFRYAKSARRLHLEAQIKGVPSPVQFASLDKKSIKRPILEGDPPDTQVTLNDPETRLLAAWLAKRYRRDSFPDEFDGRLQRSGALEAMRRLLTRWGGNISGVFVLVRPDKELSPAERYELALWAIVPNELYGNASIRSTLEDDFLVKLTAMLTTVDGITLVDAMVVSDADFTLRDVRQTRRMDFDSLSYRDDTTIAKT